MKSKSRVLLFRIREIQSSVDLKGELAQLAARVLSMHKVAGSIPAFSILLKK